MQETRVQSLGWEDPLEKEMEAHSSILAWKIPWAAEPGRLQSMGLLRVGHDWATSLLLFTFMHWRRKWKPTPVFLPGKSHGQWSLVGYCPWGHKESDTNEWREDQIRLPVDCSAEKKKYRKKWHDIFKKLKGKNLTTTKWLYLARLSLRIERQDKEFHRKAKAKWVYHH